MDLGDGHRQRRRPRLIRSLFFLLLLLTRLEPSTTVCINSSGDSEYEAHNLPSTSIATHSSKMVVSSGMTEDHSQIVNPAGRVSHPSPLPYRDGAGTTSLYSVTCPSLLSTVPSFNQPLISAGPHQLLSNNMETKASFSSGIATSSFQPRCDFLPVKGPWLNLHELDVVSELGACFAVIPGANHRQFSPILNRDFHRPCAVSVIECETLHTGSVSYGMILVPSRPPDEPLATSSITGGPPCTTNLMAYLDEAAQRERAELGRTQLHHLGLVLPKRSDSAHKPINLSPYEFYFKKGLAARGKKNGLSVSVFGNFYYPVFFHLIRHSELRDVIVFIVACTRAKDVRL